MNFGHFINDLRKKQGYSIDGVAQKSGLDHYNKHSPPQLHSSRKAFDPAI